MTYDVIYFREELEEKQRQDQEARHLKRLQDCEMLVQAYNQQKNYRLEQKEKDNIEDNLFKEKMLLQFAEQDRLEQLSDQKRRMKLLQHKRDVEKLIEEKKIQRAKDMEEERVTSLKLFETSENELKIIEEERQKLLLEFADELKKKH